MKPTNKELITDYVREQQELLYRLAYSYVNNREDALDVVQNSIVTALTHADSLKDSAAIRTWVYRIVVNESLSLLRVQKKTVSFEEETHDRACEEKGFEEALNNHRLYDAVMQLPEEIGTVLKLRFYEELSLKEIAEVTDTNLNTVKARLYRGLDRLKISREEWEE